MGNGTRATNMTQHIAILRFASLLVWLVLDEPKVSMLRLAS